MKTIKNINLKKKIIILRLDLNVPIQNGKITDKTRITKSLPTIRYLLKEDCKIIILSHLGRPKKDASGFFPTKFSLQPVRQEIEILLKEKIIFINEINETTKKRIKEKSPNKIFMLENIRFFSAETSKDEKERNNLAKTISQLGEFFVNDAFGAAHRAHASTTNLAHFLPSAIGFLIEKEISFLTQCLNNPKKPFVVILGGAKASDKIGLIKNLLEKVDSILIGGGMSYTFLKAKGYEIGKSLVDNNLIETCSTFLANHPGKIVLPQDVAITKINFSNFTILEDLRYVAIDKIRPEEEAFDIGPRTIDYFNNYLSSAQTVFWNGPLGVFECPSTAKGTNEVGKKIAWITKENKTQSIVGGGDSLAALKKLDLLEEISFASSGGGASLEFLEGKELPGLRAIKDNER